MNTQPSAALVSTTVATNEATILQDAIASVIDLAKKRGVSEVEAGGTIEAGLSLTTRNMQTETLEHHRSLTLSLTVYHGKAKGSVNVNDLSPAALEEAVKYASDIAKVTEADPFAGIAESQMLAKEIPDLDLYHPWKMTLDHAIDLAVRAEQAAYDVDKRICNSEGATVSSFSGYHVYGNSNGFLNGYWTSRHTLALSVIAQENGQMERDSDYTVNRLSENLATPEAIGMAAAKKALARLGAKKIATQKLPVLFHREVAGSLIGHLISAIKGGNQYRRTSFLYDHLNKPVIAKHISLSEHPHLAQALGSAPFDDEGVATSDKTWVKDGILQGYILDSYAARKLGMKTTGNAGGTHNLRISHSDLSFDDMIRKMHKGVIIMELIGQGVNIVNGDYSRGFAGFYVDNGTIQYPIHEMTLAGNLRDMLNNLVMIGADLEQRGNLWIGSTLLDEMTVAGSSL